MDQLRRCPNCESAMADNSIYCHNCGQKYTTGKIPLKPFLWNLIASIFNLDSRLFRTIRAIIIPGKLTEEFFKGRHKTYAHPFRLFFFMAVIHFALLGLVVFKDLAEKMELKDLVQGIEESGYRSKFLHEVDSYRPIVLSGLDSSKVAIKALDSLYIKLKGKSTDSVSIGFLVWDDSLNIQTEQIQVAKSDLIELNKRELVEKYEVKGYTQKYLFLQSIKFMSKGEDLPEFFLGKLIWMVLFLMPALALILKLLYIRRKKYFVEHLVFSFHYHAFAFFIASIAIIIDWGFDWISLGALIIILFYLYKAMRRVYKQGRIKTLIKFSILNSSYLLLFTLFFSLTIFISVLLF